MCVFFFVATPPSLRRRSQVTRRQCRLLPWSQHQPRRSPGALSLPLTFYMWCIHIWLWQYTRNIQCASLSIIVYIVYTSYSTICLYTYVHVLFVSEVIRLVLNSWPEFQDLNLFFMSLAKRPWSTLFSLPWSKPHHHPASSGVKNICQPWNLFKTSQSLSNKGN